jgi:hypothetical protein
MLMNTWSVMLTVLVLNLHHRNEDRPVPQWVRTLVFEGIARVLCMYSKDHLRRSNSSDDDDVSPPPMYARTTGRRPIVDPFALGRSNRQTDRKDGYSLAFAAAQFTGQMHNTALFVPGAASTSRPKPPPPKRSNSTSETYNNNRNSCKKESPSAERRCRELEQLLYSDNYISYELQEWKRLARIVERMFFWLTLLALIVVSVAMMWLLWT